MEIIVKIVGLNLCIPCFLFKLRQNFTKINQQAFASIADNKILRIKIQYVNILSNILNGAIVISIVVNFTDDVLIDACHLQPTATTVLAETETYLYLLCIEHFIIMLIITSNKSFCHPKSTMIFLILLNIAFIPWVGLHGYHMCDKY